MCLTRKKYLREVLTKTNMLDSKSSSTPTCPSHKLHKEDRKMFDQLPIYWSTVGSLQYPTMTRLDSAFSVNKLSQFFQAPAVLHWIACKRVLRYLASIPAQSFKFTAAPRLNLVAFSDVDWASNLNDRKSTIGTCIFLGDSLISWASKKQDVVARSRTESYYCALASTTSEIIWLRSLFSEFGVQLDPQPPVIWCNNIGAESLASNPVFHARTKHIEIDAHFVREKFTSNQLKVSYVPMEDQVADAFTKPLTIPHLVKICSKLNLVVPD